MIKLNLQEVMKVCSKKGIELSITSDPILDNEVFLTKKPKPVLSINISDLDSDKEIEEFNKKMELILKNIDV